MAKEEAEQKEKETQESSELVKPETQKSEESKPSEEMSEEFEHLPPEAKKHISKMFAMSMSSGPAPHPIFSKMNTEQVGKVIDYVEEDNKRDHNYRVSQRRYDFATIIVILLFVLALAAGCLWKDKLEYIAPIITAIVGFGGGYGLGMSRQRNQS